MKVTVRHSFEVVHELDAALWEPTEDETGEDRLAFLFNESSWCAGNVLKDLGKITAAHGCVCHIHSAEILKVER